MSDERRRKLSASAMRNWQDPEYRGKQSERIRDLWNDPERRQRQSELIRERQRERWNDPSWLSIRRARRAEASSRRR